MIHALTANAHARATVFGEKYRAYLASLLTRPPVSSPIG
jgi:hypothetical protein